MIDYEISSNTYLLVGPMRNGKTLLGIAIASGYARVYSNVTIMREGVAIEEHISSVDDIRRIPLAKSRGVILLDESSILIGARSSMSSKTKQVMDEIFLAGKKNCDLIFCGQLEKSLDVYTRDLSSYTLEVRKIRTGRSTPRFVVTTKRSGNIIAMYEMDLIEYMRSQGLTYNSIERSEVTAKDKKKKNENST